MLKHVLTTAADLFEDGWRATDRDKLSSEHDFTTAEVDAIYVELERLAIANCSTLSDITGQESGIVVYGQNVMVANWSSSCPIGGTPYLTPFGTLLACAEQEPLKVLEKYHVEDVRNCLPGKIVEDGIVNEHGLIILRAEGMEVLYDYSDALCSLWGYDTGAGHIIKDGNGNLVPTPGTIYRIEHSGNTTIVIAPDGWI